MTTPPSRSYGWRLPALPHRRATYSAGIRHGWAPHTDVDLRPLCPPVRNQMSLGACVGFTVTAAATFAIDRAVRDGLWSGPAEVLSPMWLYGRTRMNVGMFGVDSGCSLHDAIRVARDVGIAPERSLPYDPARFAEPLSSESIVAAQHLRAVNAEQLSADEDTILATLAMGFPLPAGITVYPSFEQSTTGRMTLPRDSESPIAGHAILIVGAYVENGERRVRFQNSWGTAFGEHGYGSLPVGYLTNPGLCGEVHALRVVRAG